jgi:hypothetical protein
MRTSLPTNDRLLRSLNQSGQEGEQLRGWVRRWFSGGRDLGRCPELISEINRELRHYVRRVVPCGIEEMNLPTLPDFYLPRSVVTDDWPERTMGQAVHVHFSTDGEMPLLARRFLDFVLSPDAANLRACGRPGCGRYFLRTGRRTRYHSDECAHSDTARTSMAARREMIRNKRLATARKVTKKFGKSWPFDWKSQIADAAGTTQNWVTRQVNLGDLPSPSIDRRRRAK